MSFLSLTSSARSAAAALACSVVLSTSINAAGAHTAPAPAQAAQTVIANVATAHGETVSFTLLRDGSVSVNAGLSRADAQQSVLSHGNFATPVDLFRAVAPNAQIPSALLAANERYALRKAADLAANLAPGITTQHGPVHNGIEPDVDQWFINDFCNPHSSYTVCYALPNYGWAYLDATNVYYGHSVAYADNAPLIFTVNTNGQWTVSPGYYRYAWHYQSCWPFSCNFNFDASVSNAQYFDFEADVDY